MKWLKRYASRILLLALMLFLIGCDEEECNYTPPSFCGMEGLKSGSTTLTSANPTLRVTSGTAILECGAHGTVQYGWSDNANLSDAAKKSRPPVTIKFGTQEKGVNIPAENQPAGLAFNLPWVASLSYPGEDPNQVKHTTKVHFVALVTLNQPLIKLPSKGPTISLPFIGAIVGPKPEAVDVQVDFDYYKPPTN